MKFRGYRDEQLLRHLSGRFFVQYRISADEKTALEMAKSICVEQTVEFPAAHIECGAIQDHIIGKLEHFERAEEPSGFSVGDGCDPYLPYPSGTGWRALISYENGTGTDEFTQFFNVVFGNSSLLPGITVEHIYPSARQREWFRGPKFGTAGLRERFAVKDRPFTFTALKPMGLPPEALADEAYHCALGGIDLIKDDHGLVNQPYAEFKERVRAVSAAVARGNAESGNHTAYIPNLSGRVSLIADRVKFAEECGASGIMLAPGLVGYDTLEYISAHTPLPVVAHPAMAGCFLDKGSGGFECGCALGELPRLCGADITVFPNYGGRFSLSQDQCRSIVRASTEKLYDMPVILPAPAGGMTFEKIAPMRKFYGTDVAFLMGGGLFTSSPDLTENCRRFSETVRAGA